MARKTEAILTSARTLFLERGYDATTLDDVAAASNVAKTTVYNNFRDKEHLFSEVIESITARSTVILAALEEPLFSDSPVEDRLIEFGNRLVTGVLQPSVIQLRRLAIAEAPRFPELVTRFWSHGPGRTTELLARALREADSRGELRVPDPNAAALVLAYTLLGAALDRALMVQGAHMSPSDITAHVDHSVAAFLRAYAR